MTRVLIIEPHESGHHATYLRLTVEAIVERGWTAIVATGARTLEHPEMRPLKGHARVEVRLLESGTPENVSYRRTAILRQEWRYWRMFRRTVVAEKRIGPLAAVVFPYLEYIFYTSSVLSVPSADVPWCAVSMRLWHLPPANRQRRLTLRWRMARRLLADERCRALLCINPSILDTPPEWFDESQRARLRYLPDPADAPAVKGREICRVALGLGDSQICVLVYGAISDRKGLVEVAAALSDDPRLAHYVLVVAGRVSPDMRLQFAAEPLARLAAENRLRVFDRTIDEDEQARLFAASDLVWLGYVNHIGTSGVLVLAGQAGVPVIGCDTGEIGSQVRRHDLGDVVDVQDVVAVRAALARLDDAARRAVCAANGRRAFSNHGSATFKRLLSDAIAPVAA